MKKTLKKQIWLFASLSLFTISKAWSYSNSELEKANKCIEAGQFKQARSIVEKMVDSKKSLPEALELYPIISFYDDYSVINTGSFTCARDAARMNPRSSHILATYALVLCELKKYEEGIKIINRAIELNPKDGRAHAIAAYLYKKVEDTHAANGQMEEALRLDSKSRDVNYIAAKFYWEELQGNKAEGCYKRWLQNDPNSALAHYKTARYYKDLRRLDDAMLECKKAVALNDDFVNARQLWQQILLKQKRYSEAAVLLTIFMKNCFQSFVTYSERAECYTHMNAPKKAIDDYTKAINLRSPSIAKEGFVKAVKHMEKGEKRDQISWWVARSQQYLKMQNHKQAIDDLNLLISASLNSSSIIYARAKAYESAKKYSEALKDVNQLILRDPDVTQWFRLKADLLKKMGRDLEAKEVMKRADALETSGKSPAGRGIF